MFGPFKILLLCASLLITVTAIRAAEQGGAPYTPSAQNLEARNWFQDAKFGMFIHWGSTACWAGANG